MIDHDVPLPPPGPHKGFKAILTALVAAESGASVELEITREQLRNAMKPFGGAGRCLTYRQMGPSRFRIWRT